MTESLSAAQEERAFGLRWSIKTSFIDYVRRMPGGKGWVGDGAAPVGSHEILFAPVATEWGPTANGTVERSWIFRGDVRFSGHAGMLFVQVASPTLTMREEPPVRPNSPSRARPVRRDQDGCRWSRCASTGSPLPRASNSDVRLTEAGTTLFNDVYPPGEPFEPLTVRLPILDEKD